MVEICLKMGIPLFARDSDFLGINAWSLMGGGTGQSFKDPSARFYLIKNEKRPAIVKGNIRDGGRANSYQFPIHLDSDGGGVSSITLNTTFDGHVVCGFSSISATFGMA